MLVYFIGFILLLFVVVALLARYPVIGVILAFLLIGAIVFYILRKKKEKENSKPTSKVQEKLESALKKGKKADATEILKPSEPEFGFIETKISGVTFKNEDGKSRQDILRNIYKAKNSANPPEMEISFEPYEYEGEDAVKVIVNDECIGSIDKHHVEEALEAIYNLESVFINVDRFKDENNSFLYYAKLNIKYRK